LKVYYPDFENESLTIRDCLTHHSGINPFIPNRDRLNARELKQAINQIEVTEDKSFLYTDINFLLLGFMIEELLEKDLATCIEERVTQPFEMVHTIYGPVSASVPTVKGVDPGMVHDPNARVLGRHAGSAGLFSTLPDLEKFIQHYLSDDFAKDLTYDYSNYEDKSRSLAWDLEENWLGHTGYTGTYVAFNRVDQQAIIFLTNRTFDKDERQDWIKERDELITIIKRSLAE
jgi:CubicO group peptidase (beta-lactamase class C family)